MSRRWFAGLLLSGLALFGTRAALADETEGAKASARERYQEGAKAYSDGRYMDAIDFFLDADRLASNPAFAYNIGLAYEQLGDAPDALRWYRAYLRALPEAPDRADIEPRIVQAEQRLRDRGLQQVTILSTPDGATVTVDGRRVGVAPWAGELVPGKHQVGLELRGFADLRSSFELPADQAVDVPLSLKPEPVTVVHEVPPAPSSEEGSFHGGALSRISAPTWVALGIGVAGLGSALGFELSRAAAVSSARTETNVEGKDRFDQATTYQTLSRVSLGIGSAFAIAGGILLYLDLSSKPEGLQARAQAGCAGALCGVAVHGAF